MKVPFKNALCLEGIPECVSWGRALGLSTRHRHCQRKDKHKGPHRSWSREWNDGDEESKWRKRAKLNV
jgi:hypothetical protein